MLALPLLLRLTVQMEDVLFPILERYTSTDGQDIFEEVGRGWGWGGGRFKIACMAACARTLVAEVRRRPARACMPGRPAQLDVVRSWSWS